MQLRDDEIFVIARIRDDSDVVVIAREINVDIRKILTRYSRGDANRSIFSHHERLRVVVSIEEGMSQRTVSVQAIKIERWRPEVFCRPRVFHSFRERRGVEGDVVSHELTQKGKTGWDLAVQILLPACRDHGGAELDEVLGIRSERSQIWKQPSKHSRLRSLFLSGEVRHPVVYQMLHRCDMC